MQSSKDVKQALGHNFYTTENKGSRFSGTLFEGQKEEQVNAYPQDDCLLKRIHFV